MKEKIRKLFEDKTWLHLTLALCITVVFYLLLSNIGILLYGLDRLADFVWPVILGMILAYIMDPLARMFEKRVFFKLKSESRNRALSVLCALITVILAFVVLMVALIPQIINSISVFLSNLENYTGSLNSMISKIVNLAADSNINISSLESVGKSAFTMIINAMKLALSSAVDKSISFGTGALTFIIAFILAVYFMMDKKHLLAGCDRLLSALLPEKRHDQLTGFLSRVNDTLVTFIIVELIDALMVGVVNFIFMLIAQMPYAVMISIIAAVFNLAPTFGPIAGCLIGAFILLLVNPVYALIFIIFTVLLQLFDGYIFKPKLFGDKLGVPAIWILIFIIVGGRVFGVAGILLAIPAASICDYLYNDLIIDRIERIRGKQVSDTVSEDESGEAAGDPS